MRSLSMAELLNASTEIGANHNPFIPSPDMYDFYSNPSTGVSIVDRFDCSGQGLGAELLCR